MKLWCYFNDKSELNSICQYFVGVKTTSILCRYFLRFFPPPPLTSNTPKQYATHTNTHTHTVLIVCTASGRIFLQFYNQTNKSSGENCNKWNTNGKKRSKEKERKKRKERKNDREKQQPHMHSTYNWYGIMQCKMS